MSTKNRGSWAWWNERRLVYNVAIAMAGFIAFIAFLIVGWTCFIQIDPEFEITAFTILFQAIGFLFAIGIANIAYCVGPVLEAIVPDKRLAAYRNVSFWSGFCFSVTLPFCIPLLLGVQCVFPTEFGHIAPEPSMPRRDG